MKRILVFMLVMACFTSSCSFDVEILTPIPAQSEPTDVTQDVELPVATPIVFPASPSPVSFTPTTTDPIFFGAYLSMSQDDVKGASIFPAGTEQIFAHWSYQNMREGLTVKREWYLDNEPWLTREEPWDYQKYGASGWMSDISIYDFDTGLPSGRYKLVVSINGVAQPVGTLIPEGGAQIYVEFEILPPVEAISPNGEWNAVSLLDHIVLLDKNANSSDLVPGREIISMVWLDNRHLLFVDRDRSGQVPNLLVGVRDTLRIVDITTRETWPVYESDRTLGRTGDLYPSPDGKYIATLIGSGFGDACFIDSKLGFIEVSSDYRSAEIFRQEQFSGFPVLLDQSLYPPSIGSWTSATQYTIPLNETCGTERSLTGTYVFDVSNHSVTYQLTSDKLFIAGDLGWGAIHGVVTNAVTGQPIQGALVYCDHNSYTSDVAMICAGGIETRSDGGYIYERIYFHDTDTIKLTVTAPGYQLQEYTQTFFTTNNMQVKFSLVPLQ